MKVAIVSPYRTVAPHFEAELDLAQQHIDAGDEVLFLSCNGQLDNCDFNVERDESICANCRGRRSHGLDLLDQTCQSHELKAGKKHSIPNFQTLQELIDWNVDNFDIGYAALSSLVSVIRDPEPDLNKHRSLLNRFIHSALITWHGTLAFLEVNRADRVYVYNGRFASMRAVFRACQKMNVDCHMHERGCDMHHYDILVNHLPHDLGGIDNVIRKLWDNADRANRETIGASWFLDRVQRIERNWHSFTKEQRYGQLPDGFDSSRRNVSIFCSSDDEFVAIGDSWRNTLYPNQVEAIANIAASMNEASPETKLYLRVHPNLIGVENQRKREMMSLRFPNLVLVGAEESIDTYALMKASDTVASFGSSVGIEAVYWDRPSVLLGPCLYQDLGGPIRSHSHTQTIELLCQRLEPAKEKTGALMYGHWFQARGYRYRYFEPESLFEGKFRGEVVHDREAARQAAKKKKRRSLWLFR